MGLASGVGPVDRERAVLQRLEDGELGQLRALHLTTFPMAFPSFNALRFWSDHVLALKEQLAVMDEPPLAI